MSQDHSNHDHHHASIGNIKVAFFLNLSFTLIEIVGGIMTNSIAILSDALHDLGDTLSLGLSWYFEKLAVKSRTANFSYGFKRFSLLAAFINSMILVIGSVFILFEAVPRLLSPETVHPQGMLFLSILGIVFNGAAVLRLRKGKTLNEEIVSWHLIEDILGWVAVFIASIVMMITDLPIIDPILSVLITLYILWNVVKRLLKTTRIFLQAIPEGVDLESIKSEVKELTGVLDMHDTHVWSMDGAYHILSTHIVVPDDTSTEAMTQIKEQVKLILKKSKIDHATVELEQESETCELVEC